MCNNDSVVSIYSDCNWFKFVYTGGDDTGRIDYLIKKNVTMQYVNNNEWWISENGHTQYFTYDQIDTMQPTGHTNLHELMTILKNWACLDSDGSGTTGSGESRMKVSNCLTIFNAQFRYNKQELLFDEKLVGSNALIKYTSDPPVVTLWLGAGGAANNRTIFQSKQYMPYQAENEICASIGGVLRTVLDVPNCTARIGYFDDKNDKAVNCDIGGSGAFFELDPAGVLYCCIRYFDNGVQTDTRIPQSAWNIDRLDGTGASGVVLDITKSQIFLFSLQMNGGCVKFGFNIDCDEIMVHAFKVANTLDTPTMFNYSLPLRGELRQSGVTPVTCYQKWYSCSVCLEGCITEIPVVPFNYTAHAPLTCPVKILSNPGEHRPLIAIRLKKNLCRGSIWPKRIEVTNESGSMVYWRLILNPTGFKDTDSPAPIWYDLGNSSFSQYSSNLNLVGFDNGDGKNPDEHDTNNRDALAIIIGSIMDAAGVLLAGRNAALEAAQGVLVDQTPLTIPLSTPVAQSILDAAICAANATQTSEVNDDLIAGLAALIVSTTSTINTAVTGHIAAEITLANTANGGTPAVLTAALNAAAALPSGTSAQIVAAVNGAVATATTGTINSALTSGVAAAITASNSAINTAVGSALNTAISTYISSMIVANPLSIPAGANAGVSSLAAGNSSATIATDAVNAANAVDPSLIPQLMIGALTTIVNGVRSSAAGQTAIATSVGNFTDGALAGPNAKTAAQAAAAAALTSGSNMTTIIGNANTAAQGVVSAISAAYVSGAAALTLAIATVSTCIADSAFAVNATPAEISAAVSAGMSHGVYPFGLAQGGSALDITTAAKDALQTAVGVVSTALQVPATITALVSSVKTAAHTGVASAINTYVTGITANSNVITDANTAGVTASLTNGSSPTTIELDVRTAAQSALATITTAINLSGNITSVQSAVLSATSTGGVASAVSAQISTDATTFGVAGPGVTAASDTTPITSELAAGTLPSVMAANAQARAEAADATTYPGLAAALLPGIISSRYSASTSGVASAINSYLTTVNVQAPIKAASASAADTELNTDSTPNDVVEAARSYADTAVTAESVAFTSGITANVLIIKNARFANLSAVNTLIAAYVNAALAGSYAVTAAQAYVTTNLALNSTTILSIVNGARDAAVVVAEAVYTNFALSIVALQTCITNERHDNSTNEVALIFETLINATCLTVAEKAATLLAMQTAAEAALVAGSSSTVIATNANNAALATIDNVSTSLTAGVSTLISALISSINIAAAPAMDTAISNAILAVGGNAGSVSAGITAGNLSLAAGNVPSVIAIDVTNAAVVADPSISASLTSNLVSTTSAISAARKSISVQNAIKIPVGVFTDNALAGTAAKAAARAAAVASLLTDATPTVIANAANTAAQQVMLDIATALTTGNAANLLLVKDVINKATADRIQQLVSSVVLSSGGSPTNATGANAAALVALAMPNSTSADVILAVRDYLVSQSVSNAIIDGVIVSLRNSAFAYGDIDISNDISAFANNQNTKSVILASGFMSTGIDKDVSDLFRTFGVHANINGDIPDVLALTVQHVKGSARCRGSIEFVETQ
jgi:hypothetical protein